MPEKAEGKRGILITGPDGALYNIPENELARFLVTPDRAESTILDAESAGFVEAQQPGEAEPPAPPAGSPVVINVFFGQGALGSAEVRTEAAAHNRAAMAKYAGGTTMAKYAGGTTMAKYAGGTTMGPAHAGSGSSTAATAVFYGTWPRSKEEHQP